jgi:hypothetical protein
MMGSGGFRAVVLLGLLPGLSASCASEPSGPPGVPPGGDHFCRIDRSGDLAWSAGVQSTCRVTFAGAAPLTAAQTSLLDQSCAGLLGTVVDSCPRTDVVGYCDVFGVPDLLKSYGLIYRSAINPDPIAVSLNQGSICQGVAHAPSGAVLRASCAGRVAATVDGHPLVFSEGTSCAFKSDGVQAEFSLSAIVPSSTGDDSKALLIGVHQEGGLYTYPGPGALYSEGGNKGTYQAFAYPTDPSAFALTVTSFAPRGAALKAAFSLGTLTSEPYGTGDRRTIADGTIDVAMTPGDAAP